MVKTVLGNTDLELTANTGESLLVKGIGIAAPATNYITLNIEKTAVGYFRVGGTQGNSLYFNTAALPLANQLAYLQTKGVFRPFPVGEGETLTITGAATAAAVQTVFYEVYDAGDQTPEKVNGSKADEYDYIAYGRASGIATGGIQIYDTAQNPSEFCGFPFTELVPAKTEVTIHGMAISPIAKTSGTAANKQRTEYIKVIRERTTLWDDDKNGLLLYKASAPATDSTDFGGGDSYVHAHSDTDNALLYLFPEPLIFSAGEDVDFYITSIIDAGTGNLTAEETEIALLCTLKKVA